jgi:hypothetical protein
VGLALAADSLVALSLEAGFSFSAAAPPEAPDVLGALVLEEVSLPSLLAASLLEEELSLGVLVVLVDVVEVEVVCTAAASALVSVGGVMSGVLFGTASETLLLPQALSVSPHSSAAHAASATRALTAAPCAWRTWGSR